MLGGLVAGLFLLGSGSLLAHRVLGPDYAGAFSAHRAHPFAPAIILENILIRLGYGLLLAFLYAGLRPRFGPGIRTAVVSGVFFWVATYVPRHLMLHDFAILGGWRLGASAAWGLVEAVSAGIIAGAIYRERPAGAQSGRHAVPGAS